MSDEIQILLSKRVDLPREAFHRALSDLVARASKFGLAGEWASLAPAGALSALPHVAETAVAAAPDAIVSLSGDRASLLTMLADIRFADVADMAASNLLGARRHAILPGGGPIRLHFGLRRLKRLTRAEFLDYWLNTHAELGRRLIPPYTYHQLHADQDLTDAAAGRAGVGASTLDGIVEVHFPSIAALVAQLMRPDVAVEALADERNFIDHARSAFHVYQTA
jgi:hypothetical protein